MSFQTGANLDTRSAVEKAQDINFKEIVASASPVEWKEKESSSIRRFPIFNQDGSGSCVAQTQAKELGIMRWLKDGKYVHFSATDIYQRRSNKPAAGMGAVDVRAIAQEGVTLEVLVPSQDMSDTQMDSMTIPNYMREVGKVFAVSDSVKITSGDMETVASVIQTTGKGVMIWFYFNIDEWTEQPLIKYPMLQLNDALRHSVTAVDFNLVNGKKCLVIEDSWGTSFGVAGQRIITEDFFKARNWFSSYLMNFKFDIPVTPKPHYVVGNVISLQNCLKFEGVFPSNVQSTGVYGPVTTQAVKDFQAKYGLEQVGVVGPKTTAKLQVLYP